MFDIVSNLQIKSCMRDNLEINKYRIRQGELATPDSYGMAGSFIIPLGHTRRAVVITCNGDTGSGWEHVSIHVIRKRGRKNIQETPTWKDMCFIKNLFWSDDEVVIQKIDPKCM